MHVAAFMDRLAGEGYAANTVDEYRYWVARAWRWADRRGERLAHVEAHVLREWADRLPKTWATRKQAAVALGHYFRLVGRADRPELAIRIPKSPEPRPVLLDPDQVAVLRDTAIMVGGRQGLATICAIYTAGRASEVAGIRWGGIDPTPQRHAKHGTATWWRPKTSDWHTVPMAPVLAEQLADARPTQDDGGPLFVGNNGRPHVTATTIWGWVKNVGATAGIVLTPKVLRATAGWMVLEQTGSIDLAASLLGHRSVDTTRRFYTGVASQRRMWEAVTALG